jgi:hypothetical protein
MFEVHGYTGLDESTVRQLHQDILDRRLSYARALAIAEIYRPRREG